MAENVGSAYVRIFADGRGMDGQIRDMLEDSEPSVREGGREQGRTYSEEFNKEARKGFKKNFGKTQGEIFTGLNKSLTKSLARLKLADEFFESKGWKEFRQRLVDEGGVAGADFGSRLERSFRDSGAIGSLAASMDSLGPQLRKSQAALLDQLHSEAVQINKKFDAEQKRALVAYYNDAYRTNAEFNRRVKRLRDDNDRDLEQHWRKLTALHEQYAHGEHLTLLKLQEDFRRYAIEVQSMEQGDGGGHRSRRAMIADLRQLSEGMERAGHSSAVWRKGLADVEHTLRFTHPRLTRFNNGVSSLSRGIGRAFGKGSRNNFLNFVGSVAGGIVSMLSLIPRAITAFLDLGQSIQVVFNESLKNTGSVMRATIEGLVAAATSGGAALAIFAVVVVGMIALIAPVVAAFSLLAGAITALAATITFGLVGAVAALAGALVPLAIGIGVVAAAFSSLDKAEKKALKSDLRPLVRAFRSLGAEAAKNLFDNVGRQAQRLAPIVRSLGPLFAKVGTAISNIGDHWIDAVSGPSFAKFRNMLERFIPHAVESLGISFGNALGGFAGVFRSMEPFLNRFLGWVEDITGEFARWANSAQGQEQLKQFFEDAGDSAKALGDFLGAAFDFLTDLLDAGRGTGDSIFDSMSKGLEKMTDWLKNNPDALSDWFADAEELAGDLGRVATAIGRIVDALDNVASRESVIRFFELLGWTLDALARGLDVVTDGFQWLSDAIRDFPEDIATIGQGIKDAFNDAKDAVSDFVSKIPEKMTEVKDKAIEVFEGIGDKIGEKFSNVKDAVGEALSGIVDSVQETFSDVVSSIGEAFAAVPGIIGRRFVGFFVTLPLEILAVLSGLPGMILDLFTEVGVGIGGVIDDIVAFFAELPEKIREALGDVGASVAAAFATLSTVAGDAVTAVVGFFVALPGRISGALSSMGGAIGGAFNGLLAAGQRAVTSIVGFFTALPGRIGAALSGLAGAGVGIFAGIIAAGAFAVTRVVAFFRGLPGRIAGVIGGLIGRVRNVFDRTPGAARGGVDRIVGLFRSLPGRIAGVIGGIVGRFAAVVSRLPPRAQAAIGTIVGNFRALPGKVGGAIAGIVGRAAGIFARIPPRAAAAVSNIIRFFGTVPGRVGGALSSLGSVAASKFQAMVSAASAIPGRIVALFSGLAGRIVSAIGHINIPAPTIGIPTIPHISLPTLHWPSVLTAPSTATGGLFNGAQLRIIGEAGPEAVVPLNRPLSQVDPAVRELSAIAQGMTPMARGGVVGGGRTVNVGGIQVVTPNSDARAVAAEVVNRLVAVGY